jgi:formylglycine-generating enzyme required for sulfatase activity
MLNIDFSSKASIGLTKRVPAGKFLMGSRLHPREAPARVVTVTEFDLAHVQVTVSQYSVFIESKAYENKQWWTDAGWAWINGAPGGWGRADRKLPDGWNAQRTKQYHPITGITIYEAEAYCKWIGAMKNRVARLPTEEEWEYAARGRDGRAFPWGNEFESHIANTAESESTGTVEASSMPGNVQEWTSSIYKPYAGEPVPPGELLVARGGSFNDTSFGARTSFRRGYPPGYFYPFLGFRIVVGVV